LTAVNGYYGQFEQPAEEVAVDEELVVAEALAGETETAPEVEAEEELTPVAPVAEKGESDRMEDLEHAG
jgi:hypothetical protein